MTLSHNLPPLLKDIQTFVAGSVGELGSFGGVNAPVQGESIERRAARLSRRCSFMVFHHPTGLGFDAS